MKLHVMRLSLPHSLSFPKKMRLAGILAFVGFTFLSGLAFRSDCEFTCDAASCSEWVNEAWKEGQTLEALQKVEPFTTLDAKLMSALTNVTGAFARVVDTFKETEAAKCLD